MHFLAYITKTKAFTANLTWCKYLKWYQLLFKSRKFVGNTRSLHAYVGDFESVQSLIFFLFILRCIIISL